MRESVFRRFPIPRWSNSFADASRHVTIAARPLAESRKAARNGGARQWIVGMRSMRLRRNPRAAIYRREAHLPRLVWNAEKHRGQKSGGERESSKGDAAARPCFGKERREEKKGEREREREGELGAGPVLPIVSSQKQKNGPGRDAQNPAWSRIHGCWFGCRLKTAAENYRRVRFRIATRCD